MTLTTKRLTLRPFEERDAEDLYAYAKDPRVGPVAGWPPHASLEELGLNTIWCNHYDGNERSHRVIEKCGFQYQFSQEEQVELLNECRLTHFYALSRADWENRRAVML